MVNCLAIQHVAPESPWAIDDALSRAGVAVDLRRTYAGDEIPATMLGYHGLVVMGGPMSAESDDGFPTRPAELGLITHAIDSGIPTLGVCLGAQLLALAGGAHVYVGVQGPEIGWAPVELSHNCQGDALFGGLPQKLTVLHWHGDTFDLPTGAELLISNDMYANQAFRLGEMAWGVQFHLEVTGQAVEGFLREFTDDAASVSGGSDALRRETPAALAALQSPRDLIFDRFATLIADRGEARHQVRSRRHFAHIST
jgi:GMP synthase-like glutamine amidotransferase